MKKIIFLIGFSLILVAFKQEPKNYVSLSGTIKNPNSDSLCIFKGGIIKTIKLNSEGKFSDTLKVQAGNYIIFDGKDRANVYLKNGYDLDITLDANKFDETLSFKGNGELTNNYLAKNALLKEKLNDLNILVKLDETAFIDKLKENETALKTLLRSTKDLDSIFIVDQEKEIEGLKSQLTSKYKHKKALLALNGQESPKFVDYENHNGGTNSLDDFKGKYVYIDLWATWCAPCKREIPYLKEIENKYHDKNIEFVSISIDKVNAYETWKKIVVDKALSGVQLFAKGDSSFAKALIVSSIPRFILIDPNGYIVEADAPRPSSGELIDLFNTLELGM